MAPVTTQPTPPYTGGYATLITTTLEKDLTQTPAPGNTAPSLTERIQARDGVAVVVYTRPECRQCDMTKGVLDRAGIHYTTVDVTEDEDALAYIKDGLGYAQAPVVFASTEAGDHDWSGFQPDLIRRHITDREDAA
jgi:glutaredoxin-like protein NrdH